MDVSSICLQKQQVKRNTPAGDLPLAVFTKDVESTSAHEIFKPIPHSPWAGGPKCQQQSDKQEDVFIDAPVSPEKIGGEKAAVAFGKGGRTTRQRLCSQLHFFQFGGPVKTGLFKMNHLKIV